MDDALEDEVIGQLVAAHMRLATRLPLGRAGAARFLRLLVGKPELILLSGLVVLLWLSLQSVEVWVRQITARLGRLQSLLGAAVPHASGAVGAGAAGSQLAQALGLGAVASGFVDGPSWQLEEGHVSVFAVQGGRPKMEDRYVVVKPGGEAGAGIYAVFDGHGGEFAADYAKDILIPRLQRRLAELKGSCPGGGDCTQSTLSVGSKVESMPFTTPLPITEAQYGKLLSEEILAVDAELVEAAKRKQDIAGTTALLAVEDGNMLVVANVGDSRGVLCDSRGAAIPLSFDHKPQQLKEQRRIREAGGFVAFNGVWRVAGVLATSRAMGDYPLKERQLVVAEPDVLTFALSDLRPQFALLASDGLWDTMSNEEAVTFLRQRMDEPLRGARALALLALRRGSLDNITVLVVDFRARRWPKTKK